MSFDKNNELIYNNLQNLIFNWFRDSNGIDKSIENGISVGNLVGCSAVIYFAEIHREYNLLNQEFNRNGAIKLSKKDHPLRSMVAKKIDNNFIFTNNLAVKKDIFPLTREFSHVAGKKKFSKILSIFQLTFLKFIQKPDKLYLNDWTFKNLNKIKTPYLFLNSKNIFNGAYTSLKINRNKSNKLLLPTRLDEFFLTKGLYNINRSLEKPFSDKLIEIFIEYTLYYYNKNINLFNETILVYHEFIERYKPKSIVFPGELYEPYFLIKSLCEKLGVSTEFCLDGFSLFPIYPILNDKFNEIYSYNKYVTFSKSNKNHFIKRGVDPKKIEVIKWPVFEFYDKEYKKKQSYDWIIMTWQPNPNSPSESRSSFEVLKEVLILLSDMKFNKLAVKIKSLIEKKHVEDILIKLKMKSEILIGQSNEHLSKGKNIIGGISSAVAEATYCDIPYYIYERNDLGNNSYIFNDSLCLDESYISRNILELKNNIKNKRSLLQCKDKILSI